VARSSIIVLDARKNPSLVSWIKRILPAFSPPPVRPSGSRRMISELSRDATRAALLISFLCPREVSRRRFGRDAKRIDRRRGRRAFDTLTVTLSRLCSRSHSLQPLPSLV